MELDVLPALHRFECPSYVDVQYVSYIQVKRASYIKLSKVCFLHYIDLNVFLSYMGLINCHSYINRN